MDNKMQNCKMTNQIMDLLDCNLDEEQATEFENHLKDCPQCQREYNEMRPMHDLLAEYKRPKVPKAIQQAYEKRLQETFPVQSIWVRIAERIQSPSLYPRLVGAMAILFIGIIIGRFALKPGASESTMASNVRKTPESTAIQSDRQLISQFLTQSEIWLLEMTSSPVNGSDTPIDLLTNREIASTLLAKTMFIERKAEDLNHEVLISFLSQLEMVLLETSGTQDDELIRAFEEIRLTIRETALLHEIKKIRHSIRVRPGEEA